MMAIIEQNWLMLVVITVASLTTCWIGGFRKTSLLYVIAGAVAALGLSAVMVERSWVDVATATLAYGVLVIYCPLMWLIIDHTQEHTDKLYH